MPDEAIAPGSIQAYINGDIRKRQTQEVQKLPVPRFNGRLIARYGTVDPRTLIAIGIEGEKNPDQVEGLITASVDTLLAACQGTETEIDGETHDLGQTLGAGLAAFLGLEGAQTDREGVFLIFEDELDIINTANQLKQLQQMANQQITDAVVGKSKAADSPSSPPPAPTSGSLSTPGDSTPETIQDTPSG